MSALSSGPDRALAAVSARQGQILLGVAVALAGSAVVFALGLRSVQVARAEVATVQGAALRIDAQREVATLEFARRPLQGENVPMDAILVNVVGSAQIRYVRCATMFTVSDRAAWSQSGAEQVRAKEAITTLLAARSVEELTAPGGMDAARDAIRRRVMPLFEPGLVLGLHFTELVVQ